MICRTCRLDLPELFYCTMCGERNCAIHAPRHMRRHLNNIEHFKAAFRPKEVITVRKR